VDFGTGLLVDLPTGPSNFIAQLYFEGLPAVIFKMSIRVIRGTGNATGQDDFLVKGPVWARCYPDIDFPGPPDNMRGIQFFSEKPGLLATHVLKVENAAAYGGARLTPTSDD
jgi:hypothetical protein